MTKEELKQEAEEYLKKKNYTSGYIGYFPSAYCEQAYIDGAEPREKRIAELEKENAELKKANKKLFGRFYKKGVKDYCEVEKQLTKAKELLKKFLEAKNSEDTYKAEWETEQFLKENKENDRIN